MRALYLYKLYCSNVFLYIYIFFFCTIFVRNTFKKYFHSRVIRVRPSPSPAVLHCCGVYLRRHSSINISFGSRIFFGVFERIWRRRRRRRPGRKPVGATAVYIMRKYLKRIIRAHAAEEKVRDSIHKKSRRTGSNSNNNILNVYFPGVDGGHRYNINYFMQCYSADTDPGEL